MKYKAGESVRVKSGLKGMRTTKVFVTAEMEEKEGKTVVITEVDPCSKIYRADGMRSWFEEEMLEPVEQFSAGGIVPADDARMIVTLGEMKYTHPMWSCGTVRLILSNERKNKSGIESRKEIRKRLLKL